MQKVLPYIILLAAAWALVYFGAGAREKYYGHFQTAIVTAAPYNCGTRPRMMVKVQDAAYEMRPGARACYDGRYKKGDTLHVKIHPITRGVMDDTSMPELYFGTLLGAVLFFGIKYIPYLNPLNVSE